MDRKILIVDDEADIRDILEFNLENAGFNVTDTLDVTFVPDEDVLEEAFNKGAELARSIKE